jgi:hypothetical protein
MIPEPDNRRCSVRLKEYDYSQPGAYFVTICTQNRACLLGEIVDGEMRLNDAGRNNGGVYGKNNTSLQINGHP